MKDNKEDTMGAGALDAALSTLPEPILHPALVARILASDDANTHADVAAILEALAADPVTPQATLEATQEQMVSQSPTDTTRFWWHLYGS